MTLRLNAVTPGALWQGGNRFDLELTRAACQSMPTARVTIPRDTRNNNKSITPAA